MRKDKEKAEILRRAGKSYKQIRKELGIPISTLSDWFRDASWSMGIRERLSTEASWSNPDRIRSMVAATKKKFALLHEEYRREAISEFTKLKNNPLFIAGIMLYWGEGDKSMKTGAVKLSNADPDMIKIFYLFLKKMGAQKDKIKIWLLLYPDLIDTVQKNFWSKTVGISMEQFNKSIFIRGKRPTKRLSYGVCNIEVYNRGLKEKIMKWLELYKRELDIEN